MYAPAPFRPHILLFSIVALFLYDSISCLKMTEGNVKECDKNLTIFLISDKNRKVMSIWKMENVVCERYTKITEENV